VLRNFMEETHQYEILVCYPAMNIFVDPVLK